MPDPTQQISIRLPTALLQEIETIAEDANIPRSQAIIEALQRGLGHVTQAESQPNHDGAIEQLRLELAGAIERIENLERATTVTPQNHDRDPAESQTMTKTAVLAAIKVARSTARDRATREGLSLDEWIESEYPYRRSGGGWVAVET